MKRNQTLRPFLCVIAALFVAGCGGRQIESTKDITAGQSLVISNVYQEATVKTLFDPEPRIVRSALFTGFKRFDPTQPDTWFGFNGKGQDFRADDALPGRYHFRVFDNHYVIYEYEPHNPRYEVEIGKGEAVYIGDVVVRSFGSRFRLEIRDEREKAMEFFEKRFGDSGLTFTTRLLRRVRLDPKLPQ